MYKLPKKNSHPPIEKFNDFFFKYATVPFFDAFYEFLLFIVLLILVEFVLLITGSIDFLLKYFQLPIFPYRYIFVALSVLLGFVVYFWLKDFFKRRS